MAGYQIVEPSAGSTDWTNFSTIVNNAMQGFIGLSLTNYDTTDVPLIAAGGQVEIAGSLYTFASTEAITGSLSTNQNYIMLTTSSSSITASYTSDVPVWVPSKSGYYDSSTGSQRYIGGSATDFSGKWVYDKSRDIRGSLGNLGLLTSIGVKTGSFVRNESGSTTITGIGFKPSLVLFYALNSQAGGNDWSVGAQVSTEMVCLYSALQRGQMGFTVAKSVFLRNTTGPPPAPELHQGSITSFNQDGFTFASSESTGGSLNITILYVAIP